MRQTVYFFFHLLLTTTVEGWVARTIQPVPKSHSENSNYWSSKRDPVLSNGKRRVSSVIAMSSGMDPDEHDLADNDSRQLESGPDLTSKSQGNFDGEGFANYLLPYAVALVGSILATAALFQFVLLDY